METATPSYQENLKFIASLSEVLECILESVEENQLSEQDKQCASRFTKILNSMLTIMGNIQDLQQQTDSDNMADTVVEEFISEVMDKIKTAQYEMSAVESKDMNELLREMSYTFSETCTDIENTLWDSLKPYRLQSPVKITNNGIFHLRL